ncbi:MAG: hypothetical protein JWN62_1587 [Acidimicrobiales bacterium]|nr:hypothetical protein [Acidimicrobiales bacterium]
MGEGRDRPRRDRGETLIEIVMTVVITSITVSALVSSLATAGSAGAAQRDRAAADTVMRNYAEATKQAARACTEGGSYIVGYTAPTGYRIVAAPVGGACPDVDTASTLTLTVVDPTGVSSSMQIVVRTP